MRRLRQKCQGQSQSEAEKRQILCACMCFNFSSSMVEPSFFIICFFLVFTWQCGGQPSEIYIYISHIRCLAVVKLRNWWQLPIGVFTASIKSIMWTTDWGRNQSCSLQSKGNVFCTVLDCHKLTYWPNTHTPAVKPTPSIKKSIIYACRLADKC